MERTITIDGKEVHLRASAAIPRLYRIKYNRDMVVDMQTIQRAISKQDPEKSELPVEALTLFENVAHLMAKHADQTAVPSDVNEWLEGFETFSIYTVFPVIQELWRENLRQLNEPQKK